MDSEFYVLHNNFKDINYFCQMKLISSILFLFPIIGLANDSYNITLSQKSPIENKMDKSSVSFENEICPKINMDTILKSKKETLEEYKIRTQKQLYGYDNVDEKLYIKRKNFIIGGGINFYNKLENNLSLSIGSVLFDGFYVGLDISEYLFLETRIYAPKINLYLSAKSGKENRLFTEGGSIFLGGIGYDYYLNKFISINGEISYYRYEREWTQTTISYTGSTNSDPLDFFDGWNSNTVEYYERHFGPAFSLVLQIHF